MTAPNTDMPEGLAKRRRDNSLQKRTTAFHTFNISAPNLIPLNKPSAYEKFDSDFPLSYEGNPVKRMEFVRTIWKVAGYFNRAIQCGQSVLQIIIKGGGGGIL